MTETSEAKILELIAELNLKVGGLETKSDMILAQTTKTNGSVLDLQRRVSALESASDKSNGAQTVKTNAWKRVWDIGLIVIAAIVGAISAKLKW